MRRVALLVLIPCVFGGCAVDGPLEDGRWFLPYSGVDPFLWIPHTLANVGLGGVYVAASAANFMKSLSEDGRRIEHEKGRPREVLTTP